MKTKIRVGIIVDIDGVTNDMHEVFSKQSEFYNVDGLIVQVINQNKISFLKRIINYVMQRGFLRLFSSISFLLIFNLEKLLFKRYITDKNVYKKHKLETFKIKKTYVTPQISKSGYIYRYSKKDIQKVKNEKFDILVRGGSGILKGDILKACRFGIISFHHGDNEFYRGGPPGFWEVLHRSQNTGFIIQKLNDTLDGGQVIQKGNIATIPIYIINLSRILLKSSNFMIKALEIIGKENKISKLTKIEKHSKKIFKLPNLYYQFKYLFKTLVFISRKLFFIFFNIKIFWNVSFKYIGKNSDEKSKFINIKNPKDSFFADPFLFKEKNNTICFVEEKKLSEQNGFITAIKLINNKYKVLGKVLSEDFHLSYPYVFKDGANIFMCPETSQKKEIRLYKCNEYPIKWKFHRTLIKNISSADNNIIYHNKKYWIFANVDSSNLNEHDSELHIFYSSKLDSSKWLAHKNNPVVFNPLHARNGGFINGKKDLLRVVQTQGIGIVSKNVKIAKISVLNETEYEEEIIENIETVIGKKHLATHHLSMNDEYIAFDYITRE